MAAQREIAGVECGEVIEAARWDDGRLVVRDQSGSALAITVGAGELVADVVA
jgi:hypothetical protein